MSPSGVCRFADAGADGYIKSEAVCCLVLQRYDPKLNNVRRIYSKIANAKCNSDGFKPEGITYPRTETQSQLIKETFEEVGLEPTQVNYVEAHGTGTMTGDTQELNCINDIFNDEVTFSKRQSQLYVGSVKSNIGHTEACSGICSLIKSLFAFMYEIIPPVINYSTPNPNVPALHNGRMKIVTECMPLNTDLISLSCFGFGGANTHVILQNSKSITGLKDDSLCVRKEPLILPSYQLINLAARSEKGLIDGLHKLAHQFRLYDINLKEIYLLNDVVYREQIKMGFNYTGHVIINLRNLNEEPTIHLNAEPANSRNLIDYLKSTDDHLNNNKLFYAVPGVGCQWDGMAVGLLSIPFFAQRIKQLCEIIQPDLEFDIYKLMLGELDKDQFDFNDSIFCLVAVAIYQISILDLFKEIGFKPDGYFGHSFGELICAYIDNICTDRQVLQATLVVCKLKHRYDECDKQSKPINNFLFEKGQMAVVGLNWKNTLKEIKESKVQKVNAACNNSIDCVTVSGDSIEVDLFLEHLTKKQIFNRRIASCGMAFHCDLVVDFYDHLLSEFNKIFKNSVQRSKKWISTSINPFSEQEKVSWLADDEATNQKEKQTFALYFANCILKPVLFREACEKMVSDLNQSADNIDKVFVLEIAPRSFLTSLMKSNTKGCSTSLTYLPGFSLIKKENLYKNSNSNLKVLLNVIGILNENEIYSSLSKLYQSEKIFTNGLTNCNDQNSSTHQQPLITNRLPFSSLIGWDHSADFPVPAYPEHFKTSIDENKIDLITTNYKFYLPDKSARYRLPISFYLDQVLNKFKERYQVTQMITVEIQDLIIYRLDELNEEELESLSIELLEISEHSNLGHIYAFLIRNHENMIILRGKLAMSTRKLDHLEFTDQKFEHQLSSELFYQELNCLDSRDRIIDDESKLFISKQQIISNLKTNDWTTQLDGLIQLYAYFHKKLISAEIGKQTLHIHSIIIQLEVDRSTSDKIMYNDQWQIAQSKQIELKCIQLNSLNTDESIIKIVIDQNNNIEIKNRKQVIDELSSQKLSVKYFKTQTPNLSFIGQNLNQSILGLLDKDNKFNQNNCWPLHEHELVYLSLFDSYLIAFDLLNRKCKSNYTLESVFLNCEHNFDLLIAFCDILDHCVLYVLLKDQTKSELIRNLFSKRNNLHILEVNDSIDDDFDLELLRQTDGEGTQLVISQAESDQELTKSLNCLSLNGKFIHLNNQQINVQNRPLGMAIFLKNIDFKGITLNDLDLDEIVKSCQHDKVNSILNSISPFILQTLGKMNQTQLENLFNIKFVP